MPATLALHKDTSSTLQTRKPWQSQWYTHNVHPNQADNQTNITGLFITTTHEDSWNRYQDSLDFDMSSQPTHDFPDSEMTPIIEKQIQDVKERSTAIAFLGKWKRGFTTKNVISTAVITNKDRTHKYTTFKKWKLYTRLGITTANLNAHTVRASLGEPLCKWRRPLSVKNERHFT